MATQIDMAARLAHASAIATKTFDLGSAAQRKLAAAIVALPDPVPRALRLTCFQGGEPTVRVCDELAASFRAAHWVVTERSNAPIATSGDFTPRPVTSPVEIFTAKNDRQLGQTVAHIIESTGLRAEAFLNDEPALADVYVNVYYV
jgi:hypothetical protein